MPLLEIKNLCIDYNTKTGPVHAVENINFVLKKGESVDL